MALLIFALLFHEMGTGAAERASAAASRMEMPEDARDTVEFQILPPVRAFPTR